MAVIETFLPKHSMANLFLSHCELEALDIHSTLSYIALQHLLSGVLLRRR